MYSPAVATLIVLLSGKAVEQAYESAGLYWPRYLDEKRRGIALEPFVPGLHRLAACANVTQDMDTWSDDMPWMTGYFSLAV